MTTALDWLGTQRIEDGRRWVDAAYDFQIEGATAVALRRLFQARGCG
jgi:hypothetical protein